MGGAGGGGGGGAGPGNWGRGSKLAGGPNHYFLSSCMLGSVTAPGATATYVDRACNVPSSGMLIIPKNVPWWQASTGRPYSDAGS